MKKIGSNVSVRSMATLLFTLLFGLNGIAAESPALTGVVIEVPTPPTPIPAQGRHHFLCELHITNLRSNSLELNRVEVFAASSSSNQSVASFDSAHLDKWIKRHVPMSNNRLIDGGHRAIWFVNLSLDRKSTSLPSKAHLAFQTMEGEKITEECELPVRREPPISVAPQLRGENWFAFNCLDNHSHHRLSWVPVAGRPVVPQRYAIDWIKLGPNDRPFQGDWRQVTNYYGYGVNVMAAAKATVTQMRDGMPDNPPFAVKKESVSMDAATGNHVLLRLDSTHYALYAHLQPGSIAVKVGDRVKTGQVLGRLGNSGSSDVPHLHFHMVGSDSSLFADGVPYVLKSFEWRGVADSFDALMEGKGFTKSSGQSPTQSPERRRHEFPVNNSVVSFR
jgi:murein DD-endopeptidase